jgi:kynurenine 3-monooxygenase
VSRADESPVVLGAGLAGALLGVFLARRGYRPRIYEKRADPRMGDGEGGRSINLALAARGIRALRAAGVIERVLPLLTPMRGRMIHDVDGGESFQPYGQRADEQIYSVSRRDLNVALLDAVTGEYRLDVTFDHDCVRVSPASGEIELEDTAGARHLLRADRIFGADGAGSVLRQAMVATGSVTVREEWLPHGYKELSLPPDAGGGHRLEPNALHIWPRGGFMLIALPNLDGSFTCTLFLPFEGEASFAALGDADAVVRFFGRHFPDVPTMMPDLVEQFLANPVGRMGTVRCRPWSHGSRALLVGDAAHAIVPFHGQGANCAFEDCRVLDELIERLDGAWPLVFEAFEAERPANANAIADMALENYVEMRDTVLDPRFHLKKQLAFELERRHPARFIPRYSMVMFHPEIGYAEAERRGRVQAEMLERLTAGAERLEEVDFGLADRLVEERLDRIQIATATAS